MHNMQMTVATLCFFYNECCPINAAVLPDESDALAECPSGTPMGFWGAILALLVFGIYMNNVMKVFLSSVATYTQLCCPMLLSPSPVQETQ
jgi:hypothetical protein